MASNGLHESHGFGAVAAAALGVLAAFAIAGSLVRFAAAWRQAAEADAQREAELDEWAHSDYS